MASLANGTVTKSLQQKSRGLADPYDVPSSPLKKRQVVGSMRRLKAYGHKRLKAALRAGGQLEDRALSYRQTLDDRADSYGYRSGDRAPRMRQSPRDETPINRELEESVFRTESALDDITEKARNRLIGMAFEGLCAAGEVSSAIEPADAGVGKDRGGLSWEATISGGNTIGAANIGRGSKAVAAAEHHARNEAPDVILCDETNVHMIKEEPLGNDGEDAITSLEPITAPFEDLTTDGFDEVDTINYPETEVPMGSQTTERGDRTVDVATRATVPYPASLFLDTTINVGIENIAVDYTSDEITTDNFAVDYTPGEVDTDMIDVEVSNNDVGTGWGGMESVQGHRIDESSQAEFRIRWEGLDNESATWEPEEALLSSAPRLLLQYFKGIIPSGNGGGHTVKRGRGRSRCSRITKIRKTIPVRAAFTTSVDLNSLEPQGQRHSLRSYTGRKKTPTLTTSQLSENSEAPPTGLGRGRGRPRRSGNRKLFVQVPRRTSSTLKSMETSEIFEAPESPGASKAILTRGRSRLSTNRKETARSEFLMPTATEILDAAEKLKALRARPRAVTEETQSRRGRPFGSRNKVVHSTPTNPAKNPYKKEYITDRSKRGLKPPPATYSVLAAAPRSSQAFKSPQVVEAIGKLTAFRVEERKRRGRPPGSRNKNVRAGHSRALPSTSPVPVATSESVQKRGRGRPRGSRNRNGLSALSQFYNRISKRPRQRRLHKCPPIACRFCE